MVCESGELNSNDFNPDLPVTYFFNINQHTLTSSLEVISCKTYLCGALTLTALENSEVALVVSGHIHGVGKVGVTCACTPIPPLQWHLLVVNGNILYMEWEKWVWLGLEWKTNPGLKLQVSVDSVKKASQLLKQVNKWV